MPPRRVPAAARPKTFGSLWTSLQGDMLERRSTFVYLLRQHWPTLAGQAADRVWPLRLAKDRLTLAVRRESDKEIATALAPHLLDVVRQAFPRVLVTGAQVVVDAAAFPLTSPAASSPHPALTRPVTPEFAAWLEHTLERSAPRLREAFRDLILHQYASGTLDWTPLDQATPEPTTSAPATLPAVYPTAHPVAAPVGLEHRLPAMEHHDERKDRKQNPSAPAPPHPSGT